MTRSLLSSVVVVGLTAAARADDWTGRQEVAKAAREFTTATEKLQKAIKDVNEDSPFVRELLSLSRAATRFRDAVEKGTTYDEAKKDYEKVEAGYAHFEAGLKNAHDVHHEKPVAEAAKKAKATFEQLQSHMRGRRPTEKAEPAHPRPTQGDNL